ncbi:Uncharacterized protein LW93_8149 [Fusarium fujikuroi]|nr:Uncharacterized protein LW93_8149 [Fusarium fujikuroi]
MVLKVGVIGAGIGGLSAAIALRRTGAQVEVFERSNFKDEIGAAITITPNGMRVLRHFGFDPKTARGVQNKQMRMVHPQTLEDLVIENFSHVENDYGAPFMFFHRVDLHTALKDMALSSDERYSGPPVVIHNGHSVMSLDCEKATIVLDNGQTFQKDLVVVADGVRPTHAQGAVLAIEEAAALEALFKDMQDSEQVVERLGVYNDILKRRIHVTQLLSDAQPGISSVLRQRAEDIWGEGIFPPDVMNFTRPIRDFFYSYDVMEEAEKVLARAV